MIAKRLKKGDRIIIISPSSYIKEQTKDSLKKAIKTFRKMGLEVTFSKNWLKKDKYFISAGTPKERAEDLNKAFSDKTISAIYCSQGGETANEILKLINFELIKKNPKIFVGMSDVDTLHYAINKKTGLVTFNGTDPKVKKKDHLGNIYSLTNFKKRFFRASKEIKPSSKRICLKPGIVEGKSIGCNLPSLTKLSGTEFFPDFKDSILFIEGQELNTPKTIFELEHLKQLGVFKKIKGLVIGHITNFQDPKKRKKNKIKTTFEELILNATKNYNFPILKINDFGHNCPNCFLPLGTKIRLDSQRKKILLLEDFLN